MNGSSHLSYEGLLVLVEVIKPGLQCIEDLLDGGIRVKRDSLGHGCQWEDGSVEQCEQCVLLGEVMTWEPDSVALSADSWPLSAKSA